MNVENKIRAEKLYQSSAEDFLKIAAQFKLGNLPTETPHPKSINLSSDAKNNVINAISTIKEIDQNVFLTLENNLPHLLILKNKITETIKNGGRLFLCGCGATGRLSLALETIWRHKYSDNSELKDRVISFMAGGDVALIHSVEKFEDFPEFGERQLLELGFRDGDLLISTTEGGETPFVIGATETAAIKSSNRPFILYCNPDEVLIKTAERSKKIIENPNVYKINLTVGPMALTGSTRMQATTILMYAVGLSMWYYDDDFNEAATELKKLIQFVEKNSFDFLEKFILKESDIYKNKGHLFYETDAFLGISILTDTTERSPTFSLYPFENQLDEKKHPSLSYLYFKDSKDSQKAWEELLLRKPRTFLWSEVTAQTSGERLLGFDFSSRLPSERQKYLLAKHHFFKIYFDSMKNSINFELDEVTFTLKLDGLNFLSAHIVLKILLNSLSTIIMGRLDRYESNLMTWVRASNNKLIDRAVRYADTLLQKKGISVSYEDLVRACFRIKDQIPRDQALVLVMVEEFSSKKKA